MSMRICIVIPMLNEAAGIAGALDRLQPLRARGHKVVAVDGGSTDGTPAACAGRVDELRESSPGRARQMNAGAEGRQEELLLFLHADSELPADAEASLQGFYDSGRPWGRFDVRLSGSHWSFRVIERMINWRSRLTGIATGDQGFFIRREVFEALGGFAEVPLMEDVELSGRLRAGARPFCIGSPMVTSSRRWEEHGICRTVLLMWQLRLAYWRGVPPADLVKRYYQ